MYMKYIAQFYIFSKVVSNGTCYGKNFLLNVGCMTTLSCGKKSPAKINQAYWSRP